VKEGEKIFTTTPTLVFKTEDKVSGIDFYEVRIGNLEPVRVKEGEYQTPTLTPGKYNVVVRAVDFAGNETIAVKEIEILALESPKITYYPKELRPGEYLVLKENQFLKLKFKCFCKKEEKSQKLKKRLQILEGNGN
jgi:hypothetical protein